MSKLPQSFRLNEYQRDMLHKRAMTKGMSDSEYIRYLIEQGQINLPEIDDKVSLQGWFIIRGAIISSTDARKILDVVQEESNSGRAVKSVKDLARKAGLDYTTVKQTLNRMVISKILTKDEKRRGKYNWTYQGLICLPEYAQSSSKSTSIITGTLFALLVKFLGDYDEIVDFLRTNLNINKRTAEQTLVLFFFFLVDFITWIREDLFVIHGINPNIDDVQYYRKQLINFLFLLCDLSIQKPDILPQEVSVETAKLLLIKIISNMKRQLH